MEADRPRELRCVAKTAEDLVEADGELLETLGQECLAQVAVLTD